MASFSDVANYGGRLNFSPDFDDTLNKANDEIAAFDKAALSDTSTAPNDDYFDINKFEQLLNRLEGSKGRQQRQKSLESRRDIYAQGLASMMSNF